MSRRSRPKTRQTSKMRTLGRRGIPTSRSTAAGQLLAANRDRGLGALTAERRRMESFGHFRRPSPNDRMQVHQGTRGGRPKVVR